MPFVPIHNLMGWEEISSGLKSEFIIYDETNHQIRFDRLMGSFAAVARMRFFRNTIFRVKVTNYEFCDIAWNILNVFYF